MLHFRPFLNRTLTPPRIQLYHLQDQDSFLWHQAFWQICAWILEIFEHVSNVFLNEPIIFMYSEMNCQVIPQNYLYILWMYQLPHISRSSYVFVWFRNGFCLRRKLYRTLYQKTSIENQNLLLSSTDLDILMVNISNILAHESTLEDLQWRLVFID